MKTNIIIALAISASALYGGVEEELAPLPSDVKSVVDRHDAEIARIQHRCVEELKRLRDLRTRRGEAAGAARIDKMINDRRSAYATDKIVGNWKFTRMGKTYHYTFRADGSVSGIDPINGRAFNAKWRNQGAMIQVFDSRDQLYLMVSVTFVSNVRLIPVQNTRLILIGSKV